MHILQSLEAAYMAICAACNACNAFIALVLPFVACCHFEVTDRPTVAHSKALPAPPLHCSPEATWTLDVVNSSTWHTPCYPRHENGSLVCCRYVFVEYGPLEIDLNLRVRVHELEKAVEKRVCSLPLLTLKCTCLPPACCQMFVPINNTMVVPQLQCFVV